MIAARSGRTDITNILLEGKHIDLDIQENVSVLVWVLHFYNFVHAIKNYIFGSALNCPNLPGACH